jgi:hypothetical protein
MDEQLLTLAPQLAGRGVDDQRIGFVMRQSFTPPNPLWGTLSALRRGSNHFLLRYALP